MIGGVALGTTWGPFLAQNWKLDINVLNINFLICSAYLCLNKRVNLIVNDSLNRRCLYLILLCVCSKRLDFKHLFASPPAFSTAIKVSRIQITVKYLCWSIFDIQYVKYGLSIHWVFFLIILNQIFVFFILLNLLVIHYIRKYICYSSQAFIYNFIKLVTNTSSK